MKINESGLLTYRYVATKEGLSEEVSDIHKHARLLDGNRGNEGRTMAESEDFPSLFFLSVSENLEVPWVPSDERVVETVLDLVRAEKRVLFTDLGCGDGRVAVKFAEKGIYSVCIELREDLALLARRNAADKKVDHLVEIVVGDVRHTMLRPSRAIIYTYLLPSLLSSIKEQLREITNTGSIVVSLDFEVPGWRPIYIVRVKGKAKPYTLYFYTSGLGTGPA